MKKQIIYFLLVYSTIFCAHGQKQAIELTFTAEKVGQYVSLDSIYIFNLSISQDTVLYNPDSVLLLDYLTHTNEELQPEMTNTFLTPNFPNPFSTHTTFSIYLLCKEEIRLFVHDLSGRLVADYINVLHKGLHSFIFYPGNNKIYILSVITKSGLFVRKMVCLRPSAKNRVQLIYNGLDDSNNGPKSYKSVSSFKFIPGDHLKFTAYSNPGKRIISDMPFADSTYIFHFSGNPCPGVNYITDVDGNFYNTVQIGTQCWMAENLKTTTYRNGTSIPNVSDNTNWQYSNDGAYVWFQNNIAWKAPYGGLYNWPATVDPNGLCPEGWHVPSEEEWSDLATFLGGLQQGNKLKSCRQIFSPLEGCFVAKHPRWNLDDVEYGTDDFGFSGLPGGWRQDNGNFGWYIGSNGSWWSTSEYSNYSGIRFNLYYGSDYISIGGFDKQYGFSVRCLKDDME